MDEKQIEEIHQIIENEYVKSVYQSIVSLKCGEVFAYEALSRVTKARCSMSIGEVFQTASQADCLWELEKLCRKRALKGAVYKPQKAKLFLNVDGNVMLDDQFVSGFTKDKIRKYGLKTNDVVFEITERSDFNNREQMKDLVKHYKKQGFSMALDDFGTGYSGLNRLHDLEPRYVKIDYSLIHDIHKDSSQMSLVEMLVGHSKNMGYSLIAEGIETKEELECVIHLGVEYGQGFYLGMPNDHFLETEAEIVDEIKQYYRKS